DLAPVAVELLGDELGEAGDRALAHLRADRADQSGVVRADRHPDGDLGRTVGRADDFGSKGRKAQPERESAAERGAADEEGTARSIHAFCTLCRTLPEARPSIVVILPLPTALTGTEHERIGTPLTCTVQAPHCAMPQPYLVPVRPTCSRMTHSRGVVGSTST